MTLLLLLALLFPGDLTYSKEHVDHHMCEDINDIYEEAVEHGVITREEKTELMKRCLKHANK